MKEKLGVAVVGCGAVSKNHGKAISASKQAVLLWAMDIEKAKAEAFSATYGGRPTDDWQQVLSDRNVDVIHIVTPHFTHPQLAIEAMQAGKDVFLEKPLAIHPSDGRRIIEVTRRTGRKLNVCFQNRMNDATIGARQIITSGEYGKILSASALVRWDRHGDYYGKSPWRGKYATEGGGCIINQSIHTIDLLQYLCGRVVSLSALDGHLRDATEYEVDDSAMVNFTFASGATAVGYFTNCATGFKTARVELVLEKAVVTVEQQGLTVDTSDGRHVFTPAETAHGEKSEWGLSHGRMIEAFYTAVREDKPVPVDGLAALEAVKIIAAIQYSKGKTVQLQER